MNTTEKALVFLVFASRAALFAAIIWFLVAAIKRGGRIRPDEEEDGRDD